MLAGLHAAEPQNSGHDAPFGLHLGGWLVIVLRRDRASRSPSCPDGETGRRKGLKIPHPKGYAGSIPAPGTSIHAVFSVIPHQKPRVHVLIVNHRVLIASCRDAVVVPALAEALGPDIARQPGGAPSVYRLHLDEWQAFAC
jgi:hypothetical protein